MADTATQIATTAVATVMSSTSGATNFNVGTVSRSLIEAFAAESAVQQQESEDQFAAAVLNVLSGILGYPPTGALGSVYQLTFSLSATASAPVQCPAGTAVTIPNSTLQWIIGQPITVAPGGSVTTTASCTTTGSITNVPANTITQLVSPVAGLSVTNASTTPVVAGLDPPTQAQVQAQVANQITQIQKGIGESIEAAAVASQITDASGNPTEQVVKAKFYDGVTPGTGYCYVYNGIGAMSAALIQQTTNNITGYVDTTGNKIVGPKPAGMPLYVVDAPESPVPISVAVFPAYGYTFAAIQTGVANAIAQYVAQLDMAQTFSVQNLAKAILAVPGVANVQILSPSSDLAAVPTVPNPTTITPTAVTVSPATGLVAGTYEVGITYANPWGQTEISTLASVTITAGQAIQIPALTLPAGATVVNYYLSQPAGSSVSLDASGSGEQINLAALPPADAASPPSSNTAIVNGNVYVISGTPTVSQATA